MRYSAELSVRYHAGMKRFLDAYVSDDPFQDAGVGKSPRTIKLDDRPQDVRLCGDCIKTAVDNGNIANANMKRQLPSPAWRHWKAIVVYAARKIFTATVVSRTTGENSIVMDAWDAKIPCRKINIESG